MSNQVQSLLVSIAMLAIVLGVLVKWLGHIPGFNWAMLKLLKGAKELAATTIVMIARASWWLVRLMVNCLQQLTALFFLGIARLGGNPLVGWRASVNTFGVYVRGSGRLLPR